jgi:hypothetical protein
MERIPSLNIFVQEQKEIFTNRRISTVITTKLNGSTISLLQKSLIFLVIWRMMVVMV